MKRRLLSFGTLLSLLLLSATVALWVRSHLATDIVGHSWPRGRDSSIRSIYVTSSRAQICLQWSRACEMPSMPARGPVRIVHLLSTWNSYGPVSANFGETVWNKLGFGYEHFDSPMSRLDFVRGQLAVKHTVRSVQSLYAIPYWLLALLFAALPTRWLITRIRAARRSATGRCKSCGYDLRATPKRCPECGAVASEVSA